jgi:hypothetical protein
VVHTCNPSTREDISRPFWAIYGKMSVKNKEERKKECIDFGRSQKGGK